MIIKKAGLVTRQIIGKKLKDAVESEVQFKNQGALDCECTHCKKNSFRFVSADQLDDTAKKSVLSLCYFENGKPVKEIKGHVEERAVGSEKKRKRED